MRNCFLQTTTSLLLSALMLAWAVVPLGARHIHAGGRDATHGHEDHPQAACYPSHDHPAGGVIRDQVVEADMSRPTDQVQHLHWRLLGVELSLPIPQQPAEGDEDADGMPPTLVRVVSEIMPTTSAGPSFARLLAMADCLCDGSEASCLKPILSSLNLVTLIPLCDSARLERSGVLLA